jgi:hypothetical protein
MLTQLYNNNNNRSINSNNNVNGPLGQHQKHNRKQYKLSYIVPTNFFLIVLLLYIYSLDKRSTVSIGELTIKIKL